LAYTDEQFPVLIVDRTKFPEKFQPARIPNAIGLQPGSILIDSKARLLYFAESENTVLRYGIAVGAAGRAWSGAAIVGRKAKWPTWYPTDEMRGDTPALPREIPSGLQNPLGARALYLYANGRDTLYRIHGTSEPWTIGTDASSGCIRMLNEDIIALYDKVETGAAVVVR
jgi:lipoprotein-anchoring transpeptidase ErfK/SrfK